MNIDTKDLPTPKITDKITSIAHSESPVKKEKKLDLILSKEFLANYFDIPKIKFKKKGKFK